MKKNWEVKTADPDAAGRLADSLKCHPAIATILVLRGIDTAKKAERYLQPSFRHLRPPFNMADMEKAASRICRAITKKEKILVFGDYDVDGVTGTTLLAQFLNQTGAHVSTYIPHRLREGYGLQPRHITDFAAPNGVHLLITVDNGSASHDAVSQANDAGIDVVVTDHHDLPRILPEALAVVNPKRTDCPSGLQDLAGVGVAFYLAAAVRKHLRDRGFWEDGTEPNLKKSCDLVALGTISDMVPLVRENRILASAGLDVLRSGNRLGIQVLAQKCGIDRRFITTEDIAFRIGPRINAAGRINHAKIAETLLMTDEFEKAVHAADLLNRFNSQRQLEEEKVMADISACLGDRPDLLKNQGIVLSSPDWHEGVLGIVASRLTNRYFKPAVLISEGDVMGKGSARSIPGIDLFAALTACADTLHQFGGHTMAAGLQVEKDQIDAFAQCFERAVARIAAPEDFVPKVIIDCALGIQEITPEFLDEIALLEPFGNKNPEPLFMAANVYVHASRMVGRGHRRMLMSSAAKKTNRAIWGIHFNPDPSSIGKNFFSKIAYKLQWNRWNGDKSIQLVIEDAQTE